MTMNPVPRQLEQETKDLIQEFLSKGGKISTMPAFKTSENIEYTKTVYGKKIKKTNTVQDQNNDDFS